jgi:hypothetical protein
MTKTVTTPNGTAPTQAELISYDCELTDTFGGEANYAWVRRATFEAPSNISDLAIVRRGKAALGMTGDRCRVSNYGDSVELRPYGACVVAFITPRY